MTKPGPPVAVIEVLDDDEQRPVPKASTQTEVVQSVPTPRSSPALVQILQKLNLSHFHEACETSGLIDAAIGPLLTMTPICQQMFLKEIVSNTEKAVGGPMTWFQAVSLLNELQSHKFRSVPVATGLVHPA